MTKIQKMTLPKFPLILSALFLLCISAEALAARALPMGKTFDNADYVASRAIISPLHIAGLLGLLQLYSLLQLGFPYWCYRRLRLKQPQQPKLLHGGLALLLLAGIAAVAVWLMSPGGTMARYRYFSDFCSLLGYSALGYGLIKIADVLVARPLWRRFSGLPRRAQPLTAFVVPVFLVWAAFHADQAWTRGTAKTYQIPDFTPQAAPMPRNASPDQPPMPIPPVLSLPPEAAQ